MSPDDIDEVRTRWRAALSEPDWLDGAITDRLSGPPHVRMIRSRWIIEAVTALSGILDHPRAFAPMAAELLTQRGPVTIEQLAIDRDALLGAVDEVCGPLDERTLRSWQLAIGLFDEIISSVGLNPFDEAGEDQPSGSTSDP